MARPYPRTISRTWWLGRLPYKIFLLRELSAVFMALYVIVLLMLVGNAHDGPAALQSYVDRLQSPWMIAFHVVALGFTLLHMVTWFQAVPKGMPLRFGEERVPGSFTAGLLYLGLATVSVIIAAMFLV